MMMSVGDEQYGRWYSLSTFPPKHADKWREHRGASRPGVLVSPSPPLPGGGRPGAPKARRKKSAFVRSASDSRPTHVRIFGQCETDRQTDVKRKTWCRTRCGRQVGREADDAFGDSYLFRRRFLWRFPSAFVGVVRRSLFGLSSAFLWRLFFSPVEGRGRWHPPDSEKAGERKKENWRQVAFPCVHTRRNHSIGKWERESDREKTGNHTRQGQSEREGKWKRSGDRDRDGESERKRCSYARFSPHFSRVCLM